MMVMVMAMVMAFIWLPSAARAMVGKRGEITTKTTGAHTRSPEWMLELRVGTVERKG